MTSPLKTSRWPGAWLAARRLEPVLERKTLLLITHRSSMLASVDRLIVVDGGRIVADGPKDKVLEKLAAGNLRVASTGGPA